MPQVALLPIKPSSILLGLVSACLLSACFSTGQPVTSQDVDSSVDESQLRYWHSFQPDLPISSAPFTLVHANWKQRIDQPYVYVEFVGSYTETGRLLPMIHRSLTDQGFEPAGPPFALYYDDPGQVPTERLRSRACVPVERRIDVSDGISFDVLPTTTVVYAYASGAYPDVPRAYRGMYAYMADSGWVENGPIRETYLVSPAGIGSFDDLLTEIQIPVTYSR
jgi:effector-binding domain-containing protein